MAAARATPTPLRPPAASPDAAFTSERLPGRIALGDEHALAAQFDPAARAKVVTWALTIAHRRAVDRVRAEQPARDREDRVDVLDVRQPFDDAIGTVETRMRDGTIRLRDTSGASR